MNRRVTTASLVSITLAIAACGSADIPGSGSGGSGGSNGPLIVQPQPIPDSGFAGRFDATRFTVTTSSDGIALSGVAASGAPPGEPQGGAAVAALDLTTGGAIVTGSADAAGAFTLDLAGATVGDRVLVYFPGDSMLDTAFEVPTATPADAATPCVLVDGAYGVALGTTPVDRELSLGVTFSSSCGGPVLVDGISVAGVVGNGSVTAPAPGFTVPASGSSAVETFLVTPQSATTYFSFVILASGADRHAFLLTGTAD